MEIHVKHGAENPIPSSSPRQRGCRVRTTSGQLCAFPAHRESLRNVSISSDLFASKQTQHELADFDCR